MVAAAASAAASTPPSSSSTLPSQPPPPAPPPLVVAERGPPLFTPGGAFYRAESVQARDLALLAASVRKAEIGPEQPLRVLDVMCGSGGRGARYLHQAGAAEVWSNDYDPRNIPTIALNLGAGLGGFDEEDGSSSLAAALTSQQDVQREGAQRLDQAHTWHVPGLRSPVHEWANKQGQIARATCADAGRLLAALSLRAGLAEVKSGDDGNNNNNANNNPALFQLIDLDSFGSADTHLVGLAMGALAFGGLLFLTSTDGFVSSGKRPERALAAYGAWTRPLPGAAEQGMRTLLGHAAREAAMRGLTVEPLFSYYSFHGPVFRCMVRVSRGGGGDGDADLKRTHAQRGFNSRPFGFVGHCRTHAEVGRVAFADLGKGAAAFCTECARRAAASEEEAGAGASPAAAEIAGPMWLGPLHDGDFVAAMEADAERRGWLEEPRQRRAGQGDGDHLDVIAVAERDARLYTGRVSRTNPQLRLAELLSVMRDESQPKLPPLFVESERLGRLLTRVPPRDALIVALRERGWSAARCQLERRALRTDAPMAEVLRVAEEAFEGCERRRR